MHPARAGDTQSMPDPAGANKVGAPPSGRWRRNRGWSWSPSTPRRVPTSPSVHPSSSASTRRTAWPSATMRSSTRTPHSCRSCSENGTTASALPFYPFPASTGRGRWSSPRDPHSDCGTVAAVRGAAQGPARRPLPAEPGVHQAVRKRVAFTSRMAARGTTRPMRVTEISRTPSSL
jgi:hypothetical protein